MMHRRAFLKNTMAAGGLLAAPQLGALVADVQRTDLPRPTPRQLEWQDQELGMFIHFDLPIYKPDWKWRSFEDLPAPELFTPDKLDTDQWMEAAKAFGATYAVLVAKHCSGFLTWQSDLYPYGVKQSPWRGGEGDVVRSFVDSCRKYGIKPGLYASTTCNAYWEVDNPGLVNRGKGGDPEKQRRYAHVVEQMMTELWTRYGELFEIWFDGGVLPPEKGGPDLVPLLEKYQPDAIVFQGPVADIRWIGNEKGVADYPNWATVTSMDDRNGDPEGRTWLPGECDVPVRDHYWFWGPGEADTLYSLDALMEMYYKSVGRNANLLINANPGPDGLIPEPDMQRYRELGTEIRRRFRRPVARTSGVGPTVTLDLKRPTRIDHVIIMEEIAQGERIRAYEVEGERDGEWVPLCKGISVGHKRIQQFPAVAVRKVRLRATEAVAEPCIRELAVYRVGG